MINLTTEERWICRITTMESVEEIPATRRARQKAEKRQKDRQMQAFPPQEAGASASANVINPWAAASVR
jgi:hypothetical protein